MKPLDPRLVKSARATAGYLLLVVALALLAMLATVFFAWSMASFVVEVFIGGASVESQFALLGNALVAASARALIHFAQEWLGFFAAKSVKSKLREKTLDHLSETGSGLVSEIGQGELSLLLGQGLDALDTYFSKYLPQLVFTALVTPLLAALIWYLDPASGVVVLFTLPLIPLFMVMIGLVTRDLQDKQLKALETLNGHFLEIVKGLTTLKIFGRLNLQEGILREVSDQYRLRTMKVLRLSFLSGFALELAASLSVALIAVSIGIRLVEGQLGLFVGLFILIIAPEVYLPLRNVGVQFHAASQGVAVSSRILDLLESKPSTIESMSLDYGSGLTAVTGPSGVGKSLALKGLRSESTVWMPQQSQLIPGTISENITAGQPLDSPLLHQVMKMAAITGLDPEMLVREELLSGGERQRVALARAFYRLLLENKTALLLDEPISQLDPLSAHQVIDTLIALSKTGIRVVAVTHGSELIAKADAVVKLGR